MARSRSKQSHSRKASSSYSSGRSHVGGGLDGGLARVLNLAERNYIVESLGGLVPVMQKVDETNEYLTYLNTQDKIPQITFGANNVPQVLSPITPVINPFKGQIELVGGIAGTKAVGPKGTILKLDTSGNPISKNILNPNLIGAQGVPGIKFYQASDAAGNKSVKYFWDKFSMNEIQAAFLSFTAQAKQLEKLKFILEAYSNNVKATEAQLKNALQEKYQEGVTLNSKIMANLNLPNPKIPLETIMEHKKTEKIKKLRESLEAREKAIKNYIQMLP